MQKDMWFSVDAYIFTKSLNKCTKNINIKFRNVILYGEGRRLMRVGHSETSDPPPMCLLNWIIYFIICDVSLHAWNISWEKLKIHKTQNNIKVNKDFSNINWSNHTSEDNINIEFIKNIVKL